MKQWKTETIITGVILQPRLHADGVARDNEIRDVK